MVRRKKMNKKAISLMISYVLLVSIAIIVGVGVFVWLQTIANIEPVVDCKEGTSAVLEDFGCVDSSTQLNIINNGYFNIDGVIVSFGNDAGKIPIDLLIPKLDGGVLAGHYFFDEVLGPGDTGIAEFTNARQNPSGSIEEVDILNIKTIQIQPFILNDNGEKIVCQNAVIKQEVSCN